MSREQRGELSRLTREIRHLAGTAARSCYEIGVRLLRVREKELWHPGGYESFRGWTDAELGYSVATTYRFMAIARHFNAAIARRYGMEKLSAILRYMAVTPAHELPGDVLAAKIRVRGSAGRFRTLQLHAASTREIREAVALLTETRRAGQRIPRSFRTRLSLFSKQLPAAPRGIHRGERVRIRRGTDGRLAVTFSAIAVDDLAEFVEALQRLLD